MTARSFYSPLLGFIRPGICLGAVSLLSGVGWAQDDLALNQDQDQARNQGSLANLAGSSVSTYYQIDHLCAGVEQAHEMGLDQQMGLAEMVASLLEEDSDGDLWLEAIGGSVAFAYSDTVPIWLKSFYDMMQRRMGAGGLLPGFGNLMPGFRLTNEEIGTEEYYTELYGGMGMMGRGAGPFGAILENIDQIEIPGAMALARSASERGRKHLRKQVDQLAKMVGQDLPSWVQVAREPVGGFDCHTWSFTLEDMITGGGQNPEALDLVSMQMMWGLEPQQAQQLVDWLRQKSVIIGTGWDETQDTFVIFIAGSLKDVPLRSQGTSLLDAHPEFAEMMAAAPADGFRYSGLTGEEMSQMPLDLYRDMLEQLFDDCEEVGQEFGNNLRGKTIGRVAGRFSELDLLGPVRVTGSTAMVLSLGEGLQAEMLSGLVDDRSDFSQPILYRQLLDADAPLAFAGSISPEMIELGVSLFADSIELGVPLTAQSQEVESILMGKMGVPGSETSPELIEFEHWLRGGQGRQAMEVFPALGSRLRKALSGQGGFVMDFDAASPRWAQESLGETGLKGFPRIALLAQVAHPKALEGSWPELRKGLEEFAAAAREYSAEIEQMNLVVPEPMIAHSGDLTSWFFAVQPYTTQEFMPVMTRVDDRIVLGSSQLLNEELAGVAEASVDDTALTGQIWRFDPGALEALLGDVDLELLEARAFGNPVWGIYLSMAKAARAAAGTLGPDQELQVWSRAQGDRVRTSVTLSEGK